MTRARAKAREVLADLKITSPELLRCLNEICVERGAFVKEQELDGADARREAPRRSDAHERAHSMPTRQERLE